jgi:hypothetical protein
MADLLQVIDFWHKNMAELLEAIGFGHEEILTFTSSQRDNWFWTWRDFDIYFEPAWRPVISPFYFILTPLYIFLIYDEFFNKALQDYKQIIVGVQWGAVKIYVVAGVEEKGNREWNSVSHQNWCKN